MPLTFHTADVKFSLKQKRKLKEFIARQAKQSNNQTVKLSFIFCSDNYLLNINKKFLHHDYYTDIITFPPSEDKKHIEAEIYISVERVRDNAEKFKEQNSKNKIQRTKGKRQDIESKEQKAKFLKQKAETEQWFQEELNRVMFHGALHLLGYKDKTKAQKAEMRKMEDKWLGEFKKQSTKSKKQNIFI